MAKFTASVPLNIKWQGHAFVGVSGTTHRVTDALVEEFVEEVVPGIPGFAWVTQDELTSIVTLPIAQTDVTGLTAALAGKYDKTGGTISGAVTVTGALIAQATATVAGSLVAQNNLNVTNSITGSDLSLTSGADIVGAAHMSSTLGVTGKATFGNVMAFGGTAFPGSPANNDLYYRTDFDLLFFFDGTRWLTTELFSQTLNPVGAAADLPLSATATAAFQSPVPSLQGGSDLWVVGHIAQFIVAAGGSALGASHKWVGTFRKYDSADSPSTQVTVNVDSGASAVWRTTETAIAGLINGGTTRYAWKSTWTKTGSPGNLTVHEEWYYRIVAT